MGKTTTADGPKFSAADRAKFLANHPWVVYDPKEQFEGRFSNEICAAMAVQARGRGFFMVTPLQERKDYIACMDVTRRR